MIVYEFASPTGKTKYFVAYGHVEPNEFREACKEQFGESPNIINHVYKVDKTVIKRDSKNKVVSRVETSKYCLKYENGSIRMTKGSL